MHAGALAAVSADVVGCPEPPASYWRGGYYLQGAHREADARSGECAVQVTVGMYYCIYS